MTRLFSDDIHLVRAFRTAHLPLGLVGAGLGAVVGSLARVQGVDDIAEQAPLACV